MATPPTNDNQAVKKVPLGAVAQSGTEVRLDNQSSEYARRNGIPEIVSTRQPGMERNTKDQTDVTKITATLPSGGTYRQNWLEAMRGEAKITLPFPSMRMREGQRNAHDEARDLRLEEHFASQATSTPTMERFMGRKKMTQELPRAESAQVMMEDGMEEEMETDQETEDVRNPNDTRQPQSPQQSKEEPQEPEEQAEIASGLSMSQVKRGLWGPAIATASTTGLVSLLALSGPDTASKTTAFIKAITHFLA